MSSSENLRIQFGSGAIAKNSIYNILGYVLPLIFALFLIPALIKNLGEERFGILSLSWMIIGYFSFFDFGIGRGLTKLISEKIGLNQTDQIPGLFWSSIIFMLAVSCILTIIMIILVPAFVGIFNISEGMHDETQSTFYALALSIPLISTTASIRGVLEAYQKFGTINILRIFLGIFTFLGPLIVLAITDSLFWIVVFLIFIRIIIWILYLLECFKINEKIKNNFFFDFTRIKPILKFSLWIAFANIIGPVILYSDRFLIGSLESVEALTYYVSPYEVITKLFVIPGSVTSVLFPLFSANYLKDPNITRMIFTKGIKFIFLTLYPVIAIIITFSYEGMQFWLGEKFALNSSLILQLLSVGVLMNSMGLIFDNFFQGIGKPRIPTLIYTIELPVFILAMWFFITGFGINGAALIWMTGAIFSSTTLYIIFEKMFRIKFYSRKNLVPVLLFIIQLIIPFFLNDIYFKLIFIIVSLSLFLGVTWNKILSTEEKLFIISKFKHKE